ncbi:hypothetical protein PhCBS80983_g00225 [Powellomyces hirtus]|uniref:Calnexin n=1 Tax=Powellomyces hirtus TaxID=109895 RepID=A0A507EGQ5_9FUNG|nr:hypothetical protein PhCBS80983_g00225 [Powellomyces hirtus]
MKLTYIVPAYLALISAAVAEESAAAGESAVQFHPTKVTAPFLEQFTSDWEQRWTPSHTKKVIDGVEDEDLLQYKGKWAVEAPVESPAIKGDEGLVVKDAAAHHAITAKFDKPIDTTGKPFVAQYEVKLQNGLECGGAYMKLLTADSSFDPAKFGDKTPYTIMFGPDKCGMTNKIHFIFRHKNPKTGEIEEKHLDAPPAAKSDKNTHLYTLVVNTDQTFKILVDNEEVKKGSLLTDFTPPVNPPKEIDDPNDKKPATWVDEAKMVDPEATKPEDWDEDAPLEIVDESATKPADWLDDAPLTIPDPEAEKPADWDDEEDGDWVAPTISNPACEKASGCGEWKRPMKRNPDYKGKWKAPMIDNPQYKGVWSPRKIANPDYFEDKTPSNFEKIGAIGFEIWTMQNGIMFDNVYVGHSASDAKKLSDETFAVKAKLEQKQEKEEEAKKPAAEKKTALAAAPLVDQVKTQVVNFLERARESPVDAVKELPLVAGGLAAAVFLPLLLISSLFGGESKKKTQKPVASPVPAEKTAKVTKKTVVANDEGDVAVVEKDEVVVKKRVPKVVSADSD